MEHKNPTRCSGSQLEIAGTGVQHIPTQWLWTAPTNSATPYNQTPRQIFSQVRAPGWREAVERGISAHSLMPSTYLQLIPFGLWSCLCGTSGKQKFPCHAPWPRLLRGAGCLHHCQQRRDTARLQQLTQQTFRACLGRDICSHPYVYVCA